MLSLYPIVHPCDCGTEVTLPRDSSWTVCPACGARWRVLVAVQRLPPPRPAGEES